MINTKQYGIQNGVPYNAIIQEAREHIGKTSGTTSYMMCFRVTLSEEGAVIMAKKFFPLDFEEGTELFQILDQLGVIDKEGNYDEESIKGKQVKVTIKTNLYEDRKIKQVDTITI